MITSRILRWCLSRLNRFDVGDGNGSIFFIRYDVMKTRFGSLYLHEFKRSDNARCLHDHPWGFVTLILRGGYFEETFTYGPKKGGPLICPGPDERLVGLSETRKVWHPVGYFGRYPATHAHRIELDPTKPLPWSLVWVGRKSRPWGFWTHDGWRAWVKGQGNPVCEDLS